MNHFLGTQKKHYDAKLVPKSRLIIELDIP